MRGTANFGRGKEPFKVQLNAQMVAVILSALLACGCSTSRSTTRAISDGTAGGINETYASDAAFDSASLASSPTKAFTSIEDFLAQSSSSEQQVAQRSLAESNVAGALSGANKQTAASVDLVLYKGSDATQAVIRTASNKPSFEQTRLTAPERLVIDLAGVSPSASKNIEVDGSDFLTRVRFGSLSSSKGGNRQRIVFDLASNGGTPVRHQVDMIDGALVVTLANDPAVATAQLADFLGTGSDIKDGAKDFAATDSTGSDRTNREAFWDQQEDIKAAPSNELLADQSTSQEMTGDSETAQGLTQSDSQVQAKPLAPNAESRLAELKSLTITQVSPSQNRLMADLGSANQNQYSFKRSAPSEYILVLENTKLSTDVMRSMVAPQNSGAIRSARVAQDGDNTVVRVFSQPDYELSASLEQGQITVTAQPAVEPLAQLKPEESSDTPAEKKEIELSPEVAPVAVDSDITALLEGESKWTGRLISLDLQDTDIDNALRIIAEVSNLNIIASDEVTGKVTLRLIDVPWDQALDVILKTNGLDKVQEGNVIRIAPVEKLRQERETLKEAQKADEELQALVVRYMRISYARASDVKTLVETVITERGSVAVDERTNQIIVKDIQKGVSNVVELIRKLDLRTPQVLLETQIVEAKRNFLRDLGSEVGFEYIQSPETGNALTNNFPNSASYSGSIDPSSNVGSSFPAAVSATAGSALSALFGSADGTKTLDLRLSSLEQEGQIRIVSRPSVATINNKQAIIKSVEKIRVKTPSGGLSVATGSGANNSGSNTATETFEVGIVLEVTPQASPDFYVLLDINAKSSTLGAVAVDGIPSEVERSATSTVLVASGQTFALGGIYKITDQDNLDGVPFLKDIPVLGSMFRHSKVDNGDEELIFFITPRVVEGSFDDAAMKSTV
jgi:type IV pilus secretin PilQ/predicted competence protein